MPKLNHPYRPSWPSTDIYVSPRGGEKYSGLLPEKNGHDSDGPLPSLATAFARLLDSPPVAPVTIWLDEGTYFLKEPLVIGPTTPLLTIAARPGAKVVLSGGKRITNLHETTVNGQRAWVAELPEVVAGDWYFHSLFVDGATRPRTRTPKGEPWRIASVPGMSYENFIGPATAHHGTFFCEPGQVQQWSNITDVDAVAAHYWMEERLPLSAVDPASGRVDCSVKPYYPLKDDCAARCARVWFENIAEELSEPGEWYLDRTTGVLTYLPKPEETLAETQVIAPVLEQLLRIEGTPEHPVRGIVLRDLTFAHADWHHIPGRGTDEQAAISVPAIIQLTNARQCAIENCQIGPAGSYGIELGYGCRGNRISGCNFTGLGAGGVKIIGSFKSEERCSHNILENNEVANCTHIFPSAVGVLVVHADHNIIRNNNIHHLEYTGISCGWTWGFGDSATHHNVIENNHIHHLGSGLLNDMGGIYTLGEQPGTVIRRNHIHHILAHNYGGWAVYADEGSSYILIEENLLHHTSSECFNLHYGRENILRNNVMAFSGLGVVSVSAVGADWNSLTLQRNILIADARPVLVSRDEDSLTQRGFLSDLNLLWNVNGSVFGGDEMRDEMSIVTWKRYDLAQLQQLNYDLHSIIADPQFADLDAEDFRLPADSPAFKLGFIPFCAAGVQVG